jgi:transposase
MKRGEIETPMKKIITIGVGLAKNVFQFQGVDANGAVVLRRTRRRYSCLSAFV